MTDKKIRGQNFNRLSLEERENTIQLLNLQHKSIRTISSQVKQAIFTLWSRFPDWDYAYLNITIELQPEDEVEDEE